MNDLRSDSQLVTAHLGGDRTALAGIYDRYADPLYDTAAAMLADRDEAADATQDVFLVAAQRLGQLRDPERLRAWLFAILRNEVYRRTRQQSRTRPTDPTVLGVAEMAPHDPLAEGGAAAGAELAAAVRAAAAGLDPRDQLVLELTVRQRMEGAELAAALGVTVAQSHVLVHRMRERVERSLGALTVARMGRRDCPELAGLLRDWDGTFSVLVRKRVARHVDGCDLCAETKRRYAVLPLVGAAPALAAPEGLRERVLARAAAPTSGDGYRFDADGGFPTMVRAGGRLGVIAAVAAVLLVLAGLGTTAAVALNRGDTGTEAAAVAVFATGGASAGSSTAPTIEPAAPTSGVGATPPPASTATTVTSPSTVVTLPPGSTTTVDTVPPPPAPLAPGRIELSSAVVDLGATTTAARLVLTNGGEQPVEWSFDDGGDAEPLLWSADAGVLAPGGRGEVRFTIDRAGLPEGDIVRTFTVRSGGAGGGAVEVRASVEHAPVVRVVGAPSTLACPFSVTPPVSVDVTDESAVTSVALSWSGPGASGEAALAATSTPGRWQGRLGLPQVGGTWRFDAVATDSRGNSGRASGTVVVAGC